MNMYAHQVPLYPKSVHYFWDKIPRAERGGRALPALSEKRLIAEVPVSDLQNVIYTSSQYKPLTAIPLI